MPASGLMLVHCIRRVACIADCVWVTAVCQVAAMLLCGSAVIPTYQCMHSRSFSTDMAAAGNTDTAKALGTSVALLGKLAQCALRLQGSWGALYCLQATAVASVVCAVWFGWHAQ
jgi:hypothetical protein